MAAKSIAILISGGGTNLQAIIDAVEDGRIKASIAAVISNRADARGLQRARHAGIRAVVIDQKAYPTRTDYDAALISEIDKYHPDLIALAGYMRILTDQFVRHYQNRVLNIHPSLLPDFKGLHTHRRVLESGSPIHGASVHFLSNELDSGPVVVQAEVPVKPDDTETDLAARVLQQEHIIYPMAIAWYIDGRLKVEGNHVVLDNQTLNRPPRWKSDRLIMSSAS